jgi:hypothetical protein
MRDIKKIIITILLLLNIIQVHSQIRSGVIQYERRINLLKRYPEMKMMIERRGGFRYILRIVLPFLFLL